MIVTSLKRSYPNLLDDVRQGRKGLPLEMKLEGITRGYWKRPLPTPRGTERLHDRCAALRDRAPPHQGKLRAHCDGVPLKDRLPDVR